MSTDVQIINLGLSKIAANRISIISPPRTPLEGFMAAGYTHWKKTELTKRRWVFALVEDYALSLSETLTTGVDRPYKYSLPNDCLRPIRGRYTEWVQRGRFVYSRNDTLTLNYIKNAAENEFDPLFVEVLACKVALESAEYVTQSTSKKEAALALYKDAVDIAGVANSFVIGSEDIQGNDDENFSWLAARHGTNW